MGGGSRQDQTSEVTTNTTTNVRDIGFTGAAGVDLVDILQRGAIDSEAIRATSLQTIAQQNNEGFNRLVGGASDLFTNQGDVLKDIIGSVERTTSQAAVNAKNTSREGLNTVRYLADRATGNETENNMDSKTTLYIALALAAGYGLVSTIRSK
jgi:hypothetical protein